MDKILFLFDEFGKGMGLPSMKDFFMDEKYEHQDDIVYYMRNYGKPGMAAPMLTRDFFTGEYSGGGLVHFSDGEYAWTSDLPYYVEKYNLKLPDDFIEHVLKMTGKK